MRGAVECITATKTDLREGRCGVRMAGRGLRPVMSGQDADMEPGADCRRNTKKKPRGAGLLGA
ncbi:MAG TPA: hypothetical protein DEF41_05410 [Desulfovibrio sp.]|nr:hypothetical protein [Desulfovibrio sp.]